VNSHAPNPPDLVLQRRFGDCKDKAFLMVTMLSELGIQAQPALVNTTLRRGMDKYKATPSVFNHVIVHLNFAGKEYWLDPTRSRQLGDLAYLFQPNYDRALILAPQTRGLSVMQYSPVNTYKRLVHTKIDATGDYKQAVKIQVDTITSAASTESMRGSLATDSLESLQKSYLNYFARYYPKIKVAAPIQVKEDAAQNQLTISEFYEVPDFWVRNEEKSRLQSEFYSPDIEYYLHRPNQMNRNAPMRLEHPVELDQLTEIKLPAHWNLKDEAQSVYNDYFKFDHSVQSRDKLVTIRDRYFSMKDEVVPEKIASYAKDLERARDTIGYSLYVNDKKPIAKAKAAENKDQAQPEVIKTNNLGKTQAGFWNQINWPIFYC